MADIEDITNRFKKICIDQLNVDAEKVTPTAAFDEDLGADSLDKVELIMAAEEEFGIEIPDAEAIDITTVQGAVDLIVKHLE